MVQVGIVAKNFVGSIQCQLHRQLSLFSLFRGPFFFFFLLSVLSREISRDWRWRDGGG